MFDFLLERKREYYCYIYLIEEKRWNAARIQNSLVLGIVGIAVLYLMVGLDIIPSVLGGVGIGFGIFKLTYLQLTKLDIAIGKHLKQEFPTFAITFASLLTTYDNITNAFEKAYEYTDDDYYRHLLLQVVEANKKYPEDIDQNILDFCDEIPSTNAMFLAKTLIDFREKGYDPLLMDKLIASLNVENENVYQTIVDNAGNAFVKFGTFPVLMSLAVIFSFVFAMMGKYQ